MTYFLFFQLSTLMIWFMQSFLGPESTIGGIKGLKVSAAIIWIDVIVARNQKQIFNWKQRNFRENVHFLTFPAYFLIPILFCNLNANCSNLLDMRNLQEQVKNAFCYQKLFWPFIVGINWTLISKLLQILGFHSQTKVFLDHWSIFFLQ